jgi:hypothetical protein
MSNPEHLKKLDTPRRREASSKHMEKLNKDPQFRAKMQKYLQSNRNPFKNPEIAPIIRRKATMTLREKDNFAHLNGGNGRGPTVPQKLLANRLGWAMEYVIRTGMRAGSGYPTSYKVDIADPILKIAIEVDGQKHLGKTQQVLDKKKDDFLTTLGWRVLRVTNEEVMENLEIVVKKVMDVVKSTT